MKINIVKTVAVCLFILLGMVGMATISASAGEGSACPSYPWNGKLPSDNVVVLEEINGNMITYSLKSSVVTGTSSTTPGFKSLCIMPDSKFKGSEAELSSIPLTWTKQIKGNNNANNPYFIAFSAKNGNKNNLPFDDAAHEVGKVDYTGHGELPTNQEFLIHVISASICGGYDAKGEENTCFIKPSKPNNPVPEFNSLILISVGLLGLGLVVKKYKK